MSQQFMGQEYPIATIGGTQLTIGQTAATYVALCSFAMELEHEDCALAQAGEHGQLMRKAYLDRFREILTIWHKATGQLK